MGSFSNVLLLVAAMVVLLSPPGVDADVQQWWRSVLYPGSNIPQCSNTFCEENVGLGVNMKATIMAYGDFNSDRFTDVFVLTKEDDDPDLVTVYLWQRSSFQFVPSSAAAVAVPVAHQVIPGDFNFDGMLDVMVSNDNQDGTFEMRVFLGDRHELSTEYISVGTSSDQVLMLDVNGDLYPDFFGTDANGSRTYWINNKGEAFSAQSQGENLEALQSPNSNAYVDVNGDCIADLMVFSEMKNGDKQAELWLAAPAPDGALQFTPSMTFSMPNDASQAAFADFGAATPTDQSCMDSQIVIVYSGQQRMCDSVFDTSDCRSTASMCNANPDFTIPSTFNFTESGPDATVIPASYIASANVKLRRDVLFGDGAVTMRLGDYNLDGYFDVLLSVSNSSGSDVSQLWENVACSEAFCNKNNRRSFKPVTGASVAALEAVTDTYAASFFDFDESGKPGIFVMANPPGNNTRSIVALYNGLDLDAYYLKTLGLNGRCPTWCSDGGPKFPDPKPYGVNFPGGTFKFGVTKENGKKRPAIGSQLVQSAYLSLQTPYILFGLGKTSAYIDTVLYGININNGDKDSHTLYDLGVVPNSQVAVFPYKPAKAARWKTEIYLNPSSITFWVIISCVLACVVLAVVILGLDYRERRQDKQEAEEKAHLFAFSAL